ncbi:MAG: hypothetical protein HOZ81_16640 [Streptomyces sp.]|nr:hypothetical protein [Streptomyces sp.]
MRTYQSFTYVAFVCSQKIVTWHASIKRDLELVDAPLRVALWRRSHEGAPATVVVPTDSFAPDNFGNDW